MEMSLDQIIKENKTERAPRKGRRNGRSGGPRAAAPVGGVGKKVVPKKGSTTAKIPTGPRAPAPALSKAMISGFPTDIDQNQIQRYISTSCGPLKKCELAFGPNGRSRGVVTVEFKEKRGIDDAQKKVAGTKIDGHPLKVDIIVNASNIPTMPSLADRMTKTTTPAAKTGGRNRGPKVDKKVEEKDSKTGGGKKGRSGRGGRPKPKTVEELDQEMTDYQAGGAETTTNGGVTGAVTTTNGGGDMDIAS